MLESPVYVSKFIEGMEPGKDVQVGIKYQNDIILEDKIHDKKTDVKTKESCMRSRAKIMNDIKKYTPIILKHDPHFDILKTYQNSPFNNDKVVIKSSTLFYIYKLIKRNFTFKELKSIFK